MTLASGLLDAARVWGIIGLCVAGLFLTVGIDRIDEDARGAYAFRPLLLPAVVLIWPLVLWRWWQVERSGDLGQARFGRQGRNHPVAAHVMAVLVVAALLTGAAIRQTWPSDVAPVQLSGGNP